LRADTFPDDVVELISYLLPREGRQTHPFATPGSGYLPEIWLLGSSTFSAQLAGILGLPFSFAYHFAPDLLDQALSIYRSTFKSSILLEQPKVMVAVSVLCAPSAEEAAWLSGSTKLSILQRRTGQLGLLPSPEEAAARDFTPEEETVVAEAMATHVIGDPSVVHEGLVQLQDRTAADEFMLSTRTLVAQSWGLASTRNN
jgi:luciferase family oxidoreductase group 1